MPSVTTCGICGRRLNVEADLLSGDCGNDCWGCIGKIEADSGLAESVEIVRKEIASGLRDADGNAKIIYFDESPLAK